MDRVHEDDVIELYLAQMSYIELLSDEINELVGLAYVHGWKSTRYELGKEMRQKIEEAKKKVPYLPTVIPHAASV